MQTEYAPHIDRASSHLDRENVLESEPRISLSHFTKTLQTYRRIIVISAAAVLLGYLIFAVGAYLTSSAQHMTTQAFRLDFDGAGDGHYPNGTKFNVADIISGPILTRVYRDNHLEDYIGFGDFSRSVFVLESNREYEALLAEYQVRLADPKLMPVDRERLQKEFELKRQSISKNEYSVSFNRRIRTREIPDAVARKVLLEILNDWADFAVNQQHVIAYEVSVLSPEILAPSAVEQSDLVAAIEVLRSKTNRVITNIEKIERLPGATLARTPADRLSLEEVRIRLDEIMRFRLEPMMAVVLHSPQLIADRPSTIRFLESQLAYDQRSLDAKQRAADSTREALILYEQPGESETAATKPRQQSGGGGVASGESVMPQLSDSFLDRLMTMTGRAADAQYRQKLVDDYRKAATATIPLAQAVAYDTKVLDDLRKPATSNAHIDRAAANGQIDGVRVEIGQLINKVNELFQIVSRNMTPSTQLFTLTAPPITRTLRALTLGRLMIYGLLVLLISLPAIVLICLLHNRIREEEATEEHHSAAKQSARPDVVAET